MFNWIKCLFNVNQRQRKYLVIFCGFWSLIYIVYAWSIDEELFLKAACPREWFSCRSFWKCLFMTVIICFSGKLTKIFPLPFLYPYKHNRTFKNTTTMNMHTNINKSICVKSYPHLHQYQYQYQYIFRVIYVPRYIRSAL